MTISKILADFQIKTRENYLKNYVYCFKVVDMDNDGVINEEEFTELLSKLNCFNTNFPEEVKRLLNIIDPFNNKQFTFSESISLFSLVSLIFNIQECIIDEDENGDQRKLSVLDKVCLEEYLN